VLVESKMCLLFSVYITINFFILSRWLQTTILSTKNGTCTSIWQLQICWKQ